MASYNKSVVDGKIAMWKKKEDEHREKQLINPFSEWEGSSHRKVLDKNDPEYARPVAGTMTDIRGKQAGKMVSREVQELLHVIERIGTVQENGSVVVLFGNLFEVYNKISNKLVGMLMRARKQKLVHFEGEMLWQRRDDHVPITLLVTAEEARK
ncbi:actin-binding Rho-activating protein-like [Saccoglossus kowalevskii]|uniref:Actin-binding Rho-activating protein-like n=1 Tax=Saccoglossus kowalevskii TaxID=10224 RepID=A0ABM0MEC7_SACKO|nr:PREDICTED: actin-binding Rho-activating protein-like [Saccoglossus kowalevskii]